MAQVAILREISVAFYGVELAYILAIGTWLFWTAIGALFGKKGFVPSPHTVMYVFAGILIFLPFEIAAIRCIRIVFGGIRGGYLPLTAAFSAVFILPFPVCFCFGLLFQWSARRYTLAGKTLAAAYGLESLGGIFGGIVSTGILFLGIRNLTTVFLLGGFTSLWFFISSIKKDLRAKIKGKDVGFFFPVWFFLVCFLIFAGLVFCSGTLDRLMTEWTHPNLFITKDSPYSRITVEKNGSQFVVYENDSIYYETQSVVQEEFVHMAALFHPDPGRILISSGGSPEYVLAALAHHPQTLVQQEINPVLFEIARMIQPEKTNAILASPVTRLVFADPRKYIEDADPFDLILVSAPGPDSGAMNRFYTKEFFSLCKQKLNKDGILAFSMEIPENLWTKAFAMQAASVYHALAGVFDHVLVLPGTTGIFIGAKTRLPENPEILIQRFHRRKISAKLVSPPYIRYLLSNDRRKNAESILKNTPAPVNTDLWPICYHYSLVTWVSKFFPRLLHMGSAFSEKPEKTGKRIIVFLLVAIFAFSFFPLFFPGTGEVIRVGIAGFLGMGTQSVIILLYQVKNGILFQNIGILLTSFMGGMFLGAFFVEKKHFARIKEKKQGQMQPGGTKVGPTGRGTFPPGCGSIADFLFFAFHISLFFLVPRAGSSGLVFTGILLLAEGFFVSWVFSDAGLRYHKNAEFAVSPLYAADLAGGCCAALIYPLLLIPFAGLSNSLLFGGLIFFAFVPCRVVAKIR